MEVNRHKTGISLDCEGVTKHVLLAYIHFFVYPAMAVIQCYNLEKYKMQIEGDLDVAPKFIVLILNI